MIATDKTLSVCDPAMTVGDGGEAQEKRLSGFRRGLRIRQETNLARLLSPEELHALQVIGEGHRAVHDALQGKFARGG